MQTNIKDVAKHAGVSVTTVSRVLNESGYVSRKTRDCVMRAMDELNYRPNEVARSLYSKRSHLIGLIIPTISHPFFAQLTQYIEYYTFAKGYKLILCNSLMEKEKEREYVDMSRRHQVDGIIMGSHTLDVSNFASSDFPVVTLDRQISEKIPFVSSDNYAGGMLAAEHLIQKGCRFLVHISGNLQLSMLSNKRYDGFRDACEQEKVPFRLYQTDTNALEKENYQKVIRRVFSECPEAEYCLQNGRRIPEDVKLVGYDDTSLARYTNPQITTISQPIESIAKYAVDYLIAQIAGEVVPAHTILNVELQKRETT